MARCLGADLKAFVRPRMACGWMGGRRTYNATKCNRVLLHAQLRRVLGVPAAHISGVRSLPNTRLQAVAEHTEAFRHGSIVICKPAHMLRFKGRATPSAQKGGNGTGSAGLVDNALSTHLPRHWPVPVAPSPTRPRPTERSRGRKLLPPDCCVSHAQTKSPGPFPRHLIPSPPATD